MRKLFFSVLIVFCHALAMGQQIFKKQTVLMGSVFEFSLVEKDSATAQRHFHALINEMDRIENLISEWRPHTQISQVNRNAGISPVKVDPEVWELTSRALAYSRQSHGAFDISIAALDKIWRFDGSMTTTPAEEDIRKSIENVGWKHIVLDSAASTIYLARKGMKIGFGSIGKGYAADKGRALMESLGVQAGIVNASGDLSAWGKPPQKKTWQIGIYNPFKSTKPAKILKLNRASVATSGNYEKYVEINGKRYSHIINPTTGYPSTGLTSVTVWGPKAEIANALSTSVMVMGKKDGKVLLKKFPDYHYLLISDRPQKKKPSGN